MIRSTFSPRAARPRHDHGGISKESRQPRGRGKRRRDPVFTFSECKDLQKLRRRTPGEVEARLWSEAETTSSGGNSKQPLGPQRRGEPGRGRCRPPWSPDSKKLNDQRGERERGSRSSTVTQKNNLATHYSSSKGYAAGRGVPGYHLRVLDEERARSLQLNELVDVVERVQCDRRRSERAQSDPRGPPRARTANR